MADTALIERSIDVLGEKPDIDAVLELQSQIEGVKAFLKVAEPRVKAYLIEHIKANGPVKCGDKLWVYSQKKETKCRDSKAVLMVLMDAVASDFDRINGCLAANAWKHGTVKKMLEEFGQAERYAELFEEKRVETVTGEPVKELAAIPTMFLK